MPNQFLNQLFPYVQMYPIQDSRTPTEHLALETSGLDGTGIYRRDDPFLKPWWRLQSTWERKGRSPCRCASNNLTVEAASRKGVSEAKQWHATGIPPTRPTWVHHFEYAPFRSEIVGQCRRS
jgi:hypothetical protein